MSLSAALPVEDRERVEGRLRHNLIAWLSTVRPDGQPVTVPVWFLWRDDDTVLIYSQPTSAKFRYLATNSKVSLVLDVSDLGRNVVRIEGTAARVEGLRPANQEAGYLAKYAERIAALFDSPEGFAERFSAAIVLTPSRLRTE